MDKKVQVYNDKGEAVGEVALNAAIFGVKINPLVIQQVVISMQASARLNLAHTKTRGEVRGGGKKPWRQKGTGRARAGSIRSPLWVGGGVTFGPRNDRNYEVKINKQVRRKALLMALTGRCQENEIKLVDKLEVAEFKTKTLVSLLKNLDVTKSVLVVVEKMNTQLAKSVANLPKVEAINAKDLNVATVLKYKHLVIAQPALAALDKVLVTKKK